MPRIAVTREWLQQKTAEALRVSRKLFGSTDMATYWARITASMQTEAAGATAMRQRLTKLQGFLDELEALLDTK